MVDETQEERWLKILAAEIMESLGEVRRRGGGLSADVLTQVLGDRREVRSLVERVCRAGDLEVKERGGGIEVKEEENEPSLEDLRNKYNQLNEELRHTENHCTEVEESFKNLALVLAGIARDETQPSLNRELTLLKQTLRQKIVPSRIETSAKTLKNFIIHSEFTDDLEEKAAEAGPEGIEDNVRDILILLVKDVSILEDPETQKKAQLLIRRIRNDFTLEDYESFIQDVHDLIFRLKEAIRQEKRKLFGFSQEIISRLEDAEKDFLRTIDHSTERLGPAEDDLEKKVAGEMRSIEKKFEVEGATIEQVRDFVFKKIASIRSHFQKKREEDQVLLSRMADEKAGVEKRLVDIHQRYKDFAQKSQALVQEMEKFRQASMSDGLTGAMNRRAYDLHIRRALDEFQKGALSQFGLIVFDVDKFKDFNNNYGHRAGDKILANVTRFSRESLRKEDLFFRYGGDEFTVILPEANLRNAAKIAEKIRTGINTIEFKIFKGSDKTVRIGLSLGVSMARKGDTPAEIFQRADQALYLAKEKGRNQVRTEKEIKA